MPRATTCRRFLDNLTAGVIVSTFICVASSKPGATASARSGAFSSAGAEVFAQDADTVLEFPHDKHSEFQAEGSTYGRDAWAPVAAIV
jgi:hypothetical protein